LHRASSLRSAVMTPLEHLPTFAADFPACALLYKLITQEPDSTHRTTSSLLYEFVAKIGYEVCCAVTLSTPGPALAVCRLLS